MLACAAPEVLIAAMAARTGGMRVGSGGVMLPHYSPLKVAETFSTLAGLYGDRIDLGLGRAAGTDPNTTYALQRDRREASPDDFPHQLMELLGYLEGTLPPRHPFARLAATLPGLPHRPRPWLLGSSEQSSVWAAEAGLPYAFADFINNEGAPYARSYRSRFRASASQVEPEVVVAVTAICADTEAEAQRIAASARMVRRLLRQGTLVPIPPPDEAQSWLDANPPSGPPLPGLRRGIVGPPELVREGLLQVAAEYEADEVMVLTITHDHADRRRSYELIAEAMRDAPRATDPPARDSRAAPSSRGGPRP
jgi:luciferase family oxidoreductase group 1